MAGADHPLEHHGLTAAHLVKKLNQTGGDTGRGPQPPVAEEDRIAVDQEDRMRELEIRHRRLQRGVRELPVPRGAFSLALRLFWPASDVLERRWVPPPVVRLDQGGTA